MLTVTKLFGRLAQSLWGWEPKKGNGECNQNHIGRYGPAKSHLADRLISSKSDFGELTLLPEPSVVLDRITKVFGRTTAVDNVSLEIEEGCFMTLLGPSGCGKTTLLRMIAGFTSPTRGDIFIHGER